MVCSQVFSRNIFTPSTITSDLHTLTIKNLSKFLEIKLPPVPCRFLLSVFRTYRPINTNYTWSFSTEEHVPSRHIQIYSKKFPFVPFIKIQLALSPYTMHNAAWTLSAVRRRLLLHNFRDLPWLSVAVRFHSGKLPFSLQFFIVVYIYWVHRWKLSCLGEQPVFTKGEVRWTRWLRKLLSCFLYLIMKKIHIRRHFQKEKHSQHSVPLRWDWWSR